MVGIDSRALRWACEQLGADEVVDVRGLRAGGTPWLVRLPDRSVVLRETTGELLRVEVDGLRVAAQAGVPVPGVLASDPGRGLLLVEAVGGSSRIPPATPAARLRLLGATAAGGVVTALLADGFGLAATGTLLLAGAELAAVLAIGALSAIGGLLCWSLARAAMAVAVAFSRSRSRSAAARVPRG